MKSIDSDNLLSFRASDLLEWTHQTPPSIKEQHGDIKSIKLLGDPLILDVLGHLSEVGHDTLGVNLFTARRLDVGELLVDLLLVSSDYANIESTFREIPAYLFADAIGAARDDSPRFLCGVSILFHQVGDTLKGVSVSEGEDAEGFRGQLQGAIGQAAQHEVGCVRIIGSSLFT